MRKWNGRGARRFRPVAHDAMHPERGTITLGRDGDRPDRLGASYRSGLTPAAEFVSAGRPKSASAKGWKTACDKPSPAARVMLHLRSRYVSKAAILTVPALPAPVENRSPA